jgi:hypothetical protein
MCSVSDVSENTAGNRCMVAWMMLAVIHNAASPSTIFLFIDMTRGAIPVIRMPGMIIHRLFKSVPLWVFKVKVLTENEVILLIDAWVYIPCEQSPIKAVYK